MLSKSYLLNPAVDSSYVFPSDSDVKEAKITLSSRARELQPTLIPNVTATVLAPIRSRLGKLFDGISSPFQSSRPSRLPSSSHMSTIGAGAELLNGRGPFATRPNPVQRERSGDRPQPAMHRSITGGGIELFDSGKDAQALEGSKAERRCYIPLSAA